MRNLIEAESRMVAARGWERREWEVLVNVSEVLV